MNIFIELSIILSITTLVAIAVRLLKQPLIVGYIASGIVVGPYVLNILHATEAVELFSKVGIAILLFVVGLSLNPETIRETGKPALITGIGQIVFTSVIGFFIMKGLGYENIPAMYGSIALTFSSTIIILKLLSDRGDLDSLYGKISIGFLLVQDVAATLFLVIVPLVGSQGVGDTDTSAIFVRMGILGIVAIGVLVIIAKYILPKVSPFLAKSGELLFITSLSWGLILATVFYKIGFSLEIGALIAGVTLATSKYSYEISSRMKPLRDFFIVMFFVLLGSHLVLSNISALIVPAIILSLFVLIGNPIIVFLLMNVMGYKNRTGFMAGLTVAQISEFSLILMALGLSLGHVSQSDVTLITLVGIITIVGSTYFIIFADTLYRICSPLLTLFAIRKKATSEKHIEHQQYDMIIFGFGRVGIEFVEKAKSEGLKYLAVDYNPAVFKGSRVEGVNYAFGDVDDVEFLQEIGVAESSMIISTVPDLYSNTLLTRFYRQHNADGVLLAIAHTAQDAKKLYANGATYVILPHYLGAYHATEMITKGLRDKNIFMDAREKQDIQIQKHISEPTR
jgi:Kef-type K+ transport system membrane component KefB/Trk K+ transport system NAD-binding subunit